MIVLGGYSAWAEVSDEDQAVFDSLDREALDGQVRGLGVDADPLDYVVQSTRSQTVAGRNVQFLLLAGSDPAAGSDGGAVQVVATVFEPLGEGGEPELKDVQLSEG